MSEYSSYQVPAKTNEGDAPLTQEQRDQLRTPGRAVLDHQGYRVENVQTATTAVPASEDRSNFWNYATDENGARADIFAANMDPARIFIPVPDGRGAWDRMSLAAARNTPGLIQKDGRGAYLPFPGSSPSTASADGGEQQKQQDDNKPKDETPAEDHVTPRDGDATLGEYAQVFGDSKIYQLINQAILGEEMSDAQATGLAQLYGNSAEPGRMKDVFNAFAEDYGEVVSDALIASGVAPEKVPDAMRWLAKEKKGQLVDAAYDMIGQSKRSTTAIKSLGRDYVKATGGGFSDAELESMSLPPDARWHRGQNGELLITIDGWGTAPAQSALRQGVLKP